MYRAVMASTQPNEIVEPGRAAVRPVRHVVGIAAARGTPFFPSRFQLIGE
jgi:hypothetical protein